jgi:hypothetical protein
MAVSGTPPAKLYGGGVYLEFAIEPLNILNLVSATTSTVLNLVLAW